VKNIIPIVCDPEKAKESSVKINSALRRELWICLLTKYEKFEFENTHNLPQGPGFVIKSGGSTGGPHYCLQPCQNLTQSALATAKWLLNQAIIPKDCQIINVLPLNHISGLMAWWRSQQWGCKHTWLEPSSIRSPICLQESSQLYLDPSDGPLITSLVPTQLHRLMQEKEGILWLKKFSIIWLGGSIITKSITQKARDLGIQLAPSYGATETAAMITALTPREFLAGDNSLGKVLPDIALSLGNQNGLKVRTSRIAKARWSHGKLEPLLNKDGWWESGDIAELITTNNQQMLKIIGRLDNAINSGGETVFPEKLSMRLMEIACQKKISIENLLFLGVKDKEWGERLVVVAKIKTTKESEIPSKVFLTLKEEISNWPPYEKPIAWYNCQNLKPNDLGKWDMKKWKAWITTHPKTL